MGELRKDYILNRYVLISSARGKRPHQFKKEKKEKAKIDFFAPGNEKMTPTEIGRIPKKGKWKMRWFNNKFPAVEMEGQTEIKTDNNYFTFSANYGWHEVVVETPDNKQLAELSAGDIKKYLKVMKERINDISKKDDIKYVCAFKNHGKEGGTSIVHSHSQIIALNHVPEAVMAKVNASKNFDHCPYCDIIDIEMKGERRICENDGFCAFAPYAARFNDEVWIFPKAHIRTMDEIDDKGMKMLADIMKKILVKIHELGASYNIIYHYAPEGEDLHFHIEIIPRLATWAGFENSSGVIINAVPPEDSAAFYRGEE